MSITKLFDISRQSLMAFKTAIDVSSQNVANSTNPNYTRQRVLFATVGAENFKRGILGGGVTIQDVLRVRNELTDIQIRNYNSKFNEQEKRSEFLAQIESLFIEPNELGMGAVLNQFFNSWNELSVTPNSSVLRGKVIDSAKLLAAKVASLNDGFKTVKTQSFNEAKSLVQKLNQYIEEIRQLNNEIFLGKNAENNVAHLMDKRDEVMDEISKIVNINYTIDNSGAFVLSVGGVFAADIYKLNEFELVERNGKLALKTVNGDAFVNLNSGSLYGILNTYNDTIPRYQSKIDEFVNVLMNSVNDLHSRGFTLHPSPATGINFFTAYEDGKLYINDNILQDPNYIAASANGESGDGSIARQIFDLSFRKDLLNNKTFFDNYSDIVTDLAREKSLNDKSQETNQLILQSLERQKANYIGVSIDEEMTNIIAFQKAYEASAKLISVADQMLKTLINAV